MGKYLTAEEIRQNKEYIYKNVNKKQNYFVRQGIIQSLLLEHIAKDANVVELGTGSGQLAKELIKIGYKHLYLIDIEDYLPDDFPREAITLHQLDISFNKLPFADNSVDAVLAIAVLEHLENPVLVVREVARILLLGGGSL